MSNDIAIIDHVFNELMYIAGGIGRSNNHK